MGGMVSFILFSQSYFVINLGQKKKKKEGKKHLHVSAGKSFHAKERDYANNLGSYHHLGDSSFDSGGLRKVLARNKACVCVKQICTLLLHDSV